MARPGKVAMLLLPLHEQLLMQLVRWRNLSRSAVKDAGKHMEALAIAHRSYCCRVRRTAPDGCDGNPALPPGAGVVERMHLFHTLLEPGILLQAQAHCDSAVARLP